MGAWGPYLFESDTHLDVAIGLSEDAGIELYCYNKSDDDNNDERGKVLEATRDHLNSGVLTRLFDQYLKMDMKEAIHGVSRNAAIIPLAALAMRVGAIIDGKYITMFREIGKDEYRVPVGDDVPRFDTDMSECISDQFKIAAWHYKNDGTPYDFYAVRCSAPKCRKGDAELEDGQTLMYCAKCKSAKYCDETCQKADWKRHKRVCRSPEERKKKKIWTEEEILEGGRGGLLGRMAWTMEGLGES